MPLKKVGSRSQSAVATSASRPLALASSGPASQADLLMRTNDLAQENARLRADLDHLQRTEAALRQTKERLACALEGSRLALWDLHVATGRLFLSEQWTAMLGDEPRETQTTLAEMFDLTHPDERSQLLASYTAALKGEAPDYKTEHRVRTRAGEWKWILSHGKVVERAASGYAVRIIGTNADITDRRRAEDQVRESEQRFRDVVDASGEYVWETDAQWRFRYLSKRAEAVLGHPIEALMGRRACAFMAPEESQRVMRWLAENAQPDGAFSNLEHRTLTASGDTVWQWVSGKPVRDERGNIIAYRGTGANITGRKRHEARIVELATRDPLTGLPNRSLLQDRLSHAVGAERRRRGLVAAMFIDIDRFKTINDSLGHHVGDALLKQVGARLAACVRDNDTVARPGGDEFVVVAAGLKHIDDAQRIARKILLRMNEPYLVGGHQLVITCSIGISLFPTDGDDLDSLLRQADTAMYHAKEAGGNASRFFASEMNARAVERLSLENDLRQALERGELALHYQPVVRLGSGAIVGVEALARWRHPRRGMVPPTRFIAIAEETGLIEPLGEWALATACAQAQTWRAAGFPLNVAVNLSAGQLRDGPAFVDKVHEILARTGLCASHLELEITESMLVHQVEANVETLRSLSARGVRIAVDDFGTGYSSLAYLKRLPIRGIKIDRSFVRDVVADPDNAAIVRAVVSLARSLQLAVTAEGIESREQLDALRALDCEMSQGFLFGAAVSAEEFQRRYLSNVVSAKVDIVVPAKVDIVVPGKLDIVVPAKAGT